MSRTIGRGLIVLLLLALSTFATSAERTGLWHVVQQCVLLQRVTTLTFPCAAVEQPSAQSVGSVLLKSPRSKTEFLLMPAIAILGLEDPAARTPAARGLWQTAWADRTQIDALVGHPLARGEVGLAVNSETTRTQDEFHIHIECADPRVVAAVAAVAPPAGSGGQGPFRIAGVPYRIATVAGEDLSGVDVMGIVTTLGATAAQDLAATNIAVLGASLAGGAPGFYILANTANAPAEDLLDHDCAVAGSSSAARP